MHTSNGISISYEPSLERETFVIHQIAGAAGTIAFGRRDELWLGNLEAYRGSRYAGRDWGRAREYVCRMWLRVRQDSSDGYVLAAGETTPVDTLFEGAFEDGRITLVWDKAGRDEPRLCSETGCRPVEMDSDVSKSDGTSRRRTDSSGPAGLGWWARIGLWQGISSACRAYIGDGDAAYNFCGAF